MDIKVLICVAIFYLIILATGYWASKKARQHQGKDSLQDMFLAGRKMPIWIGAMTMTATWVGGGYINGTAEAVFTRGLVWTQAPWGYALSLIVGGAFFAGVMRKNRYTTLLDPFEQKYGRGTTAVFFIPALIGELFWSAAILTALGYTFATLLNIDYTSAILISATVAIAYTLMGGLWSVAYTDVIQLVFIFAGLMMALPFALEQAGGFTRALHHYQQTFGAAAEMLPPWQAWRGLFSLDDSLWSKQIWHWLDLALLLILGGIPWGGYFQRVLACPDASTARRLSYVAGLGCFLMAIPAVIIGMLAVTVDWPSLIGSQPDGAMILPLVLKYLTPSWVAMLGLGVIASAVMSSIDSSILSVASMFTWNIYRPWQPELGAAALLRVTRWTILIVGLLATALALAIKSVYALWFLCADLVYVLLFPQLLAVLFFRRTSRLAALSGFGVGLFLRLGGGEVSLGLPGFLPYPLYDESLGLLFPFRTCAMLSSLLTIYLLAKVGAEESHSLETSKEGNDSALEEPAVV